MSVVKACTAACSGNWQHSGISEARDTFNLALCDPAAICAQQQAPPTPNSTEGSCTSRQHLSDQHCSGSSDMRQYYSVTQPACGQPSNSGAGLLESHQHTVSAQKGSTAPHPKAKPEPQYNPSKREHTSIHHMAQPCNLSHQLDALQDSPQPGTKTKEAKRRCSSTHMHGWPELIRSPWSMLWLMLSTGCRPNYQPARLLA